MELLERAEILLQETSFSDDDLREEPCFDFDEELIRISKNIDEQSSEFYSQREIFGIKRTEPVNSLSVRVVPNKNETTLKKIVHLNEKLATRRQSLSSEGVIQLHSDTEDESDAEVLFLKCVNSIVPVKKIEPKKQIKHEYRTGNFKLDVYHSVEQFDSFMEKRRGLVSKPQTRFKIYEDFVENIDKRIRDSHSSKDKPFKVFVREFKKAIFSFSHPLKPGFKCHDDNFFRIDNVIWHLPCQNESVSKKAYTRFVKAKFNQKKMMESLSNLGIPLSNEKQPFVQKSPDHDITCISSPTSTFIPPLNEHHVVMSKEMPVVLSKEIPVVQSQEMPVVLSKEMPVVPSQPTHVVLSKEMSVVRFNEMPVVQSQDLPVVQSQEMSVVLFKEMPVVQSQEANVVLSKEMSVVRFNEMPAIPKSTFLPPPPVPPKQPEPLPSDDPPPTPLYFDPFPKASIAQSSLKNTTDRNANQPAHADPFAGHHESNKVHSADNSHVRNLILSRTANPTVQVNSSRIGKLTPEANEVTVVRSSVLPGESPSTSGGRANVFANRHGLFPVRFTSMPISFSSCMKRPAGAAVPNPHSLIEDYDITPVPAKKSRFQSVPVGPSLDKIKPCDFSIEAIKTSFFDQKVVPLTGPASSIQLVNNSLFARSMKVIESEGKTSDITPPKSSPLVDTSILLKTSASPPKSDKQPPNQDEITPNNTSSHSPLRIDSDEMSPSPSRLMIDIPMTPDEIEILTPEIYSCVSQIVNDVENCPSVLLDELIEITCELENERSETNRAMSVESDLSYHTVEDEQDDLELLTVNDSQDFYETSSIVNNQFLCSENCSPIDEYSNYSNYGDDDIEIVSDNICSTPISETNTTAEEGLYFVEDQEVIASTEKEPEFTTSTSDEECFYPIVTIEDEDEEEYDIIQISPLDKRRNYVAIGFSNPFTKVANKEDDTVPIITLEDFTAKPPNTTFLLQHLEDEFPVEKAPKPEWRLVPMDAIPGEGLRLFEKYNLPNHIELPLRNTECSALLDPDFQPVIIPLISLAPKRRDSVCPVVTIDDDEDEEEIFETHPHPGMVEFLNSLGVTEYNQRKIVYKKVHNLLTAEEQRNTSNYSYFLTEEVDLMERGLVPFFGTVTVKRYTYPFHPCEGLYWPIFQPTDGLPVTDSQKLMVADVYNQITNQTCYSYAQKKDLLCDSSPNIWNTQFREVMDKSDSYLADKGRFKFRVAYARSFIETTEVEARKRDLIRQLEEAFWIRQKLEEQNILAVSDQEESRIAQEEVTCSSNTMNDHIRFNITDKYSSLYVDRIYGEREDSIYPESWQQYPHEYYLCSNSRRNLIPDAVNHLNAIVYKEIDNIGPPPPSEEHILETQKAILHAAYLFQRGRVGNQSSLLLSEEENRLAKERIGKMKALLFTITYNEKSSSLTDLWDLLALQDWEIKYWPIIWDNLAATYKKLPTVSILTETFLDELDQAFTQLVNLNDRREYCKMYYSKLDLRKPRANVH